MTLKNSKWENANVIKLINQGRVELTAIPKRYSTKPTVVNSGDNGVDGKEF